MSELKQYDDNIFDEDMQKIIDRFWSNVQKNEVCWTWLKGLDKDGYWDLKNWMNCPHSETEQWVKIACKIFLTEGCETLSIIPSNSMCTSYAESCIEPHAEYHPIFERPKFLMDKKEIDVARNSYFVVIWRKK